jgi:hypothetical protein
MKKALETNCYKKELIIMDGYQQSKTMIDIKPENRKDLKSSQILILHHKCATRISFEANFIFSVCK